MANFSAEYTAGNSIELVFDLDVSVTGMTMYFAVARQPGDTPVLTTADGSAVASATGAQQFTVAIADEETEALRGTYAFGAEIEDLAGDREEVARGYLSFVPPMI